MGKNAALARAEAAGFGDAYRLGMLEQTVRNALGDLRNAPGLSKHGLLERIQKVTLELERGLEGAQERG